MWRYFLAVTGILLQIAAIGQRFGCFNQDYPQERQIAVWCVWTLLAFSQVYPNLEVRKFRKVKRNEDSN